MFQLIQNQQLTNANTTASFLSIPGEVRNNIYKLILLDQDPIDPRLRYDEQQKLTPGLLRVNKVVHDEASSLFYGHNRFDFTCLGPHQVASFLEEIGGNNAGHIRHVLIHFPKFRSLNPGDITLEEDSINILSSIESNCSNLSTLTASLYSTSAMELRLHDLDNRMVANEALEMANSRFRAISSLQDINLEVYVEGPSDHIRGRMKSHGWTVSTTEYEEEEEDDWDRNLSDFGDHDDDYDIDDDSDFWRRAGD